jgi:hypothetical protein
MTSSVIAVSGLRKAYGDKTVLDGIDLDVRSRDTKRCKAFAASEVFTPNPVDERRLRDGVTWFEREGDQQPAQPGTGHVGEDTVIRAKLE